MSTAHAGSDRPHGSSELLTGDRPNVDARLIRDIMNAESQNDPGPDPDVIGGFITPSINVRSIAATPALPLKS